MIITEELIEIFLELIKIEALSGNEKPVADYIKSFLSDYDLDLSEDDSYKYTASDTGNIIIRYKSGGDFVMLSHMDTVRSTKNVRPIVDKIKIRSGGDTILGVDNRAGVAVLLYVLKIISKNKIDVKDFTIAFTTCEETTMGGSKNLCLNENIKKAFVFDSSNRPGYFINSACGLMEFKAVITGKDSHSGLEPEKGINSIQAAAKAVSNIKQGRIDNETTVNVGKINGGSAVNVVPGQTIVEGEVRSIDTKKIKRIMDQIESSFLKETEEVSAKLEFQSSWDFEPYTIAENNEVYKIVNEAIKNVGLEPVPTVSLAGSDANSLNAKGISAINLGIGAQNPHSNNEFILIEDLKISAEIALELIKRSK